MKKIWIPAVLVQFSTALLPVSAALAQEDNIDTGRLLSMSLAELSNLEVTSVSKKTEKANEAAAAVFVITQEDIRRSGATTIPEALRMAPGVNVAQAGAHDWAVSVRGFNGQFANKLLVLVDRRTVYNPMFSGTFWDVQDTLLEDIDRIEIIRGPGAAQWGANAVNGVINIITKSAKDTQGGLFTTTAGNMIRTNTGIRYGVKTGDDSYARMYAKYNNNESEYNIGAGPSADDWRKQQAGFRSDSKLTDKDSLTFQGDMYNAIEDVRLNLPTLTAPYSTTTSNSASRSGSNLMARWKHEFSPQSVTYTQVYFDRTQQKYDYASYNTTTYDADFQHIWTGWKGHELIWGGGYRYISDHAGTTSVFQLNPQTRNNDIISAFLQDKITLHPDDLFLTLGTKFEHNDFTGIELQPSARLSYLISDKQMVWGSVSRAIHPSNRFISDAAMRITVAPPGAIVPGLPTAVSVAGAKDLDSEEMLAFEMGYRIQPMKSLSLDFAAFFNRYDELFYSQNGTGSVAGGGTYYYQPIFATNRNDATSKGFEVSAKIDATKNWQIASTYSYLNLSFGRKDDTAFSFSNNPKHQFNVRSTYLFPYDIEMTNSLYYVAALNSANIPGYYRFDTKVSYEIVDNVQLSLVGQNLLDKKHQEFSGFLFQNPVRIGRSVYGNITWKF